MLQPICPAGGPQLGALLCRLNLLYQQVKGCNCSRGALFEDTTVLLLLMCLKSGV